MVINYDSPVTEGGVEMATGGEPRQASDRRCAAPAKLALAPLVGVTGSSPAKSSIRAHRKDHGCYRYPKLPLPAFIEQLYGKRFGKHRPDAVLSLEDRARQHEQKKRSGAWFEG